MLDTANFETLCAEGNRLADLGRYPEALQQFSQAWALVPEPKNEVAGSTWVITAIADVLFLDGNYPEAKRALDYAMSCPEAIGNPFIHLRMGQCCFELGAHDQAADELTRAYMGGGQEILAHDDPKYFTFLQTRIQPPLGGKW